MKHPKTYKYFDTSKTYLCPMIRDTTFYPNEVEDIIDVKLVEEQYGYFVIPQLEGYKEKYFFDLFLDWLLYTKIY